MNFFTTTLLLTAIAAATAEEKITYCMKSLKNGAMSRREFDQKQVRWQNANAAKVPMKSNALKFMPNDDECVKYLDSGKQKYCKWTNWKDEATTPADEYTKLYWVVNVGTLNERTFDTRWRWADMDVCDKYLTEKQEYCIIYPPNDEYPEGKHVIEKLSIQGSFTDNRYKDYIVDDMNLCTVVDNYCLEKDSGGYQLKAFQKKDAHFWSMWAKVVDDMSLCAEDLAKLEEKKRLLAIQMVKDAKVAEAARLAEIAANTPEAKKAAAIKAAKAERDFKRREILMSEELPDAQALMDQHCDEATAAEMAFEQATDAGESTAEELELLKEDQDIKIHACARSTALIDAVQKAIEMEGLTAEQKAIKANAPALYGVTENAGKQLNKKANGNRIHKTRDPLGGPEEYVCTEDHRCAVASGDPHIVTFDGSRFDCHGHGEFVLVKDLDSQFEIQGRFVDVRSHDVKRATHNNKVSGARALAVNTGVAGVPSIDVHVEEIFGEDSDDKGCSLNYYMDGKPVTSFGDDGNAFNGIHRRPESMGMGGGGKDTLYFKDTGLFLTIYGFYGNWGCMMSIDVCISEEMSESARLVGLFGTPDGNKLNEWTTKTGKSLFHGVDEDGEDKDKIHAAVGYEYCTENWCTTAEESIFGYLPGETHADHSECDAIFNSNFGPDLINDETTEECAGCCAQIRDHSRQQECLLECNTGDVLDCENFILVEDTMLFNDRCEEVPEYYKKPCPAVKPTFLEECDYEGQCEYDVTCCDGSVHTGYKVTCDTDGIAQGYSTNVCDEIECESEETTAPTKAPTTKAPSTTPPTPPPKNGPTNPPKGSGSGDPHFKTWTGSKFDYHGECDLVLVDNPSFADGLGLKLHIRTTRVKYFSFIEKVALQIGDDVLEFDNDAENFLINGVPVGENKKHHKTMLGGFLVRRDPKAISVRLNKSGKGTDVDGRAKIDFHVRQNGFPAVIVDAGHTDIFEGSLGLLGEYGSGIKLARDGKSEMDDDDATAFALEWQVRDTEPMLFKDSRFPQFPSVCTPPAKMRVGSTHFKAEAEEACAHWKDDMEDCIFDVMATRDILVAEEGHIVHIE